MAPAIRKNPTLSDDLINEILVRLPVKSLVRFESVSKTWSSLIKDPAFVKSRLFHAMTIETDRTLFVKRYSRNNHFAVLHVDSRQIVADLELPYPRGESFRLVGSANGIVCVYVNLNTRPTSIYLWNPAIRQYKLIPSYSVSHYSRGVLGFGYDPIDDDFKVVRVESGFLLPRCIQLIGMYGEKWLIRLTFLLEISMYVSLLSLMNMTIEDNAHVIEYNKCISVIILMHIGRSGDEFDCRFYEKINVWMLDDDACLRGGGVEASWTPMLSIDLDSPSKLSYLYFSNGDFLLLTTHDDDNMWILRNADMKDVKIVPLSVDTAVELYLVQIYQYTESLVSLGGFRQVYLNAAEDDN
ncbi:hypothetical protein OROMI_029772 [Orobanche minor]